METAEIRFYKLLKKNNFSEEDAGEFVAIHREMQFADLVTKADLKADLAEAEQRIKTTLTWRLLMFWLGQVGIFLAFAYRIFPGM